MKLYRSRVRPKAFGLALRCGEQILDLGVAISRRLAWLRWQPDRKPDRNKFVERAKHGDRHGVGGLGGL